MSTIDLIILGIVSEKPQSAYDIQKDVEQHNLSAWTKISVPSVYKKVLRLQECGYLNSNEVQGDKFATKQIYSITDKGKQYFESLMTNYADAPVNILLDFNAVISNLNKVSHKTAIELIDKITVGIEQSKHYYEEALSEHSEIPFVGKTIMEQQAKVCDALLEWAKTLRINF